MKGLKLYVDVSWRGSLASSPWALKGWPSMVVQVWGRYELFEFFIDKKEESDAFLRIA